MKINMLVMVLVLTLCASACSSGKSAEPVEIHATMLWSEFVSDIETAANKYDGCLMAITGTIAEMPGSFMGEPCILLENGADTIPNGIFCFFNDEAELESLECGDTVTVSGTCSVAMHIASDQTPFVSIESAYLG